MASAAVCSKAVGSVVDLLLLPVFFFILFGPCFVMQYLLSFLVCNHLAEGERAGPKVIKPLSCSIQLSTKCILSINVKMPTIVDILTFISTINTTFKA